MHRSLQRSPQARSLCSAWEHRRASTGALPVCRIPTVRRRRTSRRQTFGFWLNAYKQAYADKAEAEKDANKNLFNCAQRVHQVQENKLNFDSSLGRRGGRVSIFSTATTDWQHGYAEHARDLPCLQHVPFDRRYPPPNRSQCFWWCLDPRPLLFLIWILNRRSFQAHAWCVCLHCHVGPSRYDRFHFVSSFAISRCIHTVFNEYVYRIDYQLFYCHLHTLQCHPYMRSLIC